MKLIKKGYCNFLSDNAEFVYSELLAYIPHYVYLYECILFTFI